MKDYIDWNGFRRAQDRYEQETDRMIEDRYADDDEEEIDEDNENIDEI